MKRHVGKSELAEAAATHAPGTEAALVAPVEEAKPHSCADKADVSGLQIVFGAQTHFPFIQPSTGLLCSYVSQLGKVEVKSGETLSERNMGVGRWRRRWRWR